MLCKLNLCEMKAVEDEFHFIMKCPFYIELHACCKLLSKSNTLIDSDMFILVMSASGYDCLPVNLMNLLIYSNLVQIIIDVQSFVL